MGTWVNAGGRFQPLLSVDAEVRITGRELAAALFDSCRSIAASAGGHADDRFLRRSPFIPTLANDR